MEIYSWIIYYAVRAPSLSTYKTTRDTPTYPVSLDVVDESQQADGAGGGRDVRADDGRYTQEHQERRIVFHKVLLSWGKYQSSHVVTKKRKTETKTKKSFSFKSGARGRVYLCMSLVSAEGTTVLKHMETECDVFMNT